MYGYYVVLFHNEIIQDTQTTDSEIILKFVILSLKMQVFDKNLDPQQFFNRLRLYISLFKNPIIDSNSRNQFADEIIAFIKTIGMKSCEKDIYKSLLDTMNVILCDLNHCFTVKIKENLSQVFDTMKIVCGQKYLDCILFLQKLCEVLIKDLKERSELDIILLKECNKKLDMLVKSGVNTILIQTCSSLSNLFQSVVNYYSNCKDLWALNCKPDFQFELIKLFDSIGRSLSKSVVKTDLIYAITITSYAGSFVETSARLDLELSDNLHKVSIRCLNRCCSYLQTLKQDNYEKYRNMWRVIGTILHNICVVFYKNQNYKTAFEYAQLFSKYVILDDSCFENSFGASLHLYGLICLNLNRNKLGMIYFILVILKSDFYRLRALHSLITLKSKLSDDNPLKSLTIHHFLRDEQAAIQNIYTEYQYDNTDVENLLIQEFNGYIKNWPSRNSLVNCCNDLCSVSDNVMNRTFCFINSWEKVLCLSNQKYIKNVQHTIDMIKSESIEEQLCLSVLNYVLYQIKMYDVMNKNLEDMNNANIPLKSLALEPHEEPPNPHDKCDIVPAYYNMRIETLLPLYELLNHSTEIWSKYITETNEEQLKTLGTKFNLFKIIKDTAFEYRLQNIEYHMLKTWTIYLKYGTIITEPEIVVTATGFLLEYSTFECETIKNLLKESELIILELEKDSSKLDMIVTYYINKSTGYLNSNLYREGFQALRTAEKYAKDIQKREAGDEKITEARLLYLRTCYLLLSCEENIMEHEENFLITAQNSFNIIAEYYKHYGSRRPYLLSILLEISIANGWLYKWLRLPRETRCYTKDSVFLAQKYVLSIKTSQFLSLLAFVDLLDCQYDDCEVKLNGLTKILCCSTSKPLIRSSKSSRDLENSLAVPKTVGKIRTISVTTTPTQSVLDVPEQQRRFIQGSPELNRRPFLMPTFIKHAKHCDCYKCLNIEYQKLTLDTIHIEALLNSYQNVIKSADEYFHGGLLIYEHISNKSNSFSCFSLQLDSRDINVGLYKKLSTRYCSFMLDLTYFYVQKKNNFPEANNIMDNILNFIGKPNNINTLLWNEIFEQKLNLIDSANSLADATTLKESENELNVFVDTVLSKTPDNKIEKPILSLTLSPCAHPKPVKKVIRKIAFDLLDCDDEKPVTPEITKQNQFKFQTPGKTPAPITNPKITVYTPKTVKKSSNPKVEPKTELTSQYLKSRTRLLTEKLKSEKKNILKDSNTRSKDSRGICKNLQDDLNDVIENVDKLSIDCKKPTRTTRVIKKPNLKLEPKTNRKLEANIVESTIVETKKKTRKKANAVVKKGKKMVLYSSSDSSS